MKFQRIKNKARLSGALATLALLAAAPAVHAQNRLCVVDDVTWEVVCGRQASPDEISEYYARRNGAAPSNNSYGQNGNYANVRPAPVVVQQQPIVVQQPPVYVPAPQVIQQPVVIAPAPQPSLFEIFAQSQNKRPPEEERMSEREAKRNINRLFQEVLGREADYLALQNFSNAAMKGRSLEDIRLELARSEEGREVIRRAYREILKREADPSGLSSFHQKLINGESLTQIRNELASSDEAKRRR